MRQLALCVVGAGIAVASGDARVMVAVGVAIVVAMLVDVVASREP